jgi:hexosaminidase
MIDSARHFLSIESINKVIDAMSAAKMNNLHWHITDDQSFPLCLTSYPQLCQAGAYFDAYGKRMTFTTEQVKGVVSYATARGVRVTPELDLPGHSKIFAAGEPTLYIHDDGACTAHPLPDITNDAFFDFLGKIFDEFTTLFPDGYIHNGGDEVRIYSVTKLYSMQLIVVTPVTA